MPAPPHDSFQGAGWLLLKGTAGQEFFRGKELNEYK